MADAGSVLEAMRDFGRAVADFHRSQQELDRLEEDWLRETRWVGYEFTESLAPDEEDEDLKEALQNVLWSADVSGLPAPVDEYAASLLEERPVADIERCIEDVRKAEDALAGPHQSMVRNLRAWFDQARHADDGVTSGQWRQILKAWRSAVDLTAREAAAALEIPPSAVIRYEQGKRAPATPYIAAMIEWIAAVREADRDPEKRKVLAAMASMVGAQGPTEVLEQAFASADESELALREDVEQRLDALSEQQLQRDRSPYEEPAGTGRTGLGGGLARPGPDAHDARCAAVHRKCGDAVTAERSGDPRLRPGEVVTALVSNPVENPGARGKVRPVVLVAREGSRWLVMGLTTNANYRNGRPRTAVPEPPSSVIAP